MFSFVLLMKKNLLKKWYAMNLGKIVFLLLIVVFFALMVVYAPFLNVIITPEIRTGISIVTWYILFSPRTKTILYICFVILVIGFLYTIIGVSSLIDSVGVLLFLLIIFILINYIKEEIV